MRVVWITLAALSLLAGCSSGAIGSACAGGPTEENVCVEGAICAMDPDPSVDPPNPPNAVHSHCRALCDSESDCTEPGFECREVSGSMARACQPEPEEDDGTPPPSDGGV